MYTGHLGKAAVLVGRGLPVEKQSAPWALWAMLSQSPLQTEQVLAAFVAWSAWLLFAQMQDAEGMEGQMFLQSSHLWFMEEP